MIQFGLTPEEEKKLMEWDSKHKKCRHLGTALGGRLIFSFTPTGLGVWKKVSCFNCGKELIFEGRD